MRRAVLVGLFLLTYAAGPAFAQAKNDEPDYAVADPELKIVRIDSDPKESFLAVRADTQGRLFVGGREAVFVYEPDAKGGYYRRQLLYRFPADTWVYDIEFRGNDLYVMTNTALYLIRGGVRDRAKLQANKLISGVPLGHVHQCLHALAWGPEGDLYFSMGDPLWCYGDFDRPDHWGHWTFFCQPPGTKVPYTGVGGIFRCKPDGSDLRIVARGLRNACGLCFDRHFNLFTNDNDHEGLPALYVPGRLLHVTPHADFSWPRGWMAEKSPDRADLLETMTTGMGRAVPVLQAYYDEDFLPAKYRNNLLVARWCTRSLTRYPLETRGASFKAKEEPLLVGKNQARPMGVCVGRGGRIFATIAFMAHNENSPVYQSDLVMITRKDDAPAHPFERYEASTADEKKLWEELAQPSFQRRYRAHLEVLRDGTPLWRLAYRRMLEAKANEPALTHLIWLTWRAADWNTFIALFARSQDKDPFVRRQAVRALAELKAGNASWFNKLLKDKDERVQHAALQGFFHTGFRFSFGAGFEEEDIDVFPDIVQGPARSSDTYLRQTATVLLGEKATLDQLEKLCASKDDKTRLGGILAAGYRLTVPPATKAIPHHLPLTKLREESAYVIDYADGKVDLRKLGRVGNFTLAEHWKVGKHTLEQQRLFALLLRMLDDPQEPARLQAAHFLYLLNDPRSEPKVAAVRRISEERKLQTAPLHAISKVWLVGPFPDGKGGLKTVHPPEQRAIDLAADYRVGKSKLVWKETAPQAHSLYNLTKMFGPSNNSSFYAYTRLESPARQRVLLLVGSDDGVKVWNNGREVWVNDLTRGVLPFEDVVVLDLQPGSNDLLVRVHNRAGDSGLYLHYRGLGQVVPRLPDKVAVAGLAERLKTATKEAAIGKEFFEVDWENAVKEGDVKKGRLLFGTLACIKCHAITNDAAVSGGPSLAEARKRFTVPYLVESILLPSKQTSPVFKASLIETKTGKVLTGLVVSETAEKLEVILPDASRVPLPTAEVAARRLLEQSPMPAGAVRTPQELRDLLAYLLSDNPLPP
jgi:putative heme-binding domain-containing protein